METHTTGTSATIGLIRMRDQQNFLQEGGGKQIPSLQRAGLAETEADGVLEKEDVKTEESTQSTMCRRWFKCDYYDASDSQQRSW